LGKNKNDKTGSAPLRGDGTKQVEDGAMTKGPKKAILAVLSRGRAAWAASALIAAGLGFMAGSAQAQQAVGSATGLAIPRYVSLKSDHVNLREGPSKDHATKWIYQRASLPVEITAEFETWRRVRDSEGAEGWVLHSLLSGKRTVLISPWKKNAPPLPLYAQPQEGSNVAARLAPGVVASVKSCDGNWCRLKGEGYDGYMSQTNLWGVYPGEKVE
jgi:SH3-like domain-containing protein